MLALLLLPFLFSSSFARQNPATGGDNPSVQIVSFKWFKDRQPAEHAAQAATPQPQVDDTNNLRARQRRENAPAGDRDPNLDTVDSRSSALDKIVQDSRESPPINGFTYLVKFQNNSAITTQTIFWEYRFTESARAANVSRRRFMCSVKIKPQKQTDLRVFSTLGPSNVIDVKDLPKGSGDHFQEAVVIDRVEYADGSTWQRKDWKSDEGTMTVKTKSDAVSPCKSF